MIVERFGIIDPRLRELAQFGQTRVSLRGTQAAEAKTAMSDSVDKLTGDRFRSEIHRAKGEETCFQGFYNRNVPVDGYLVREKISRAAAMDLTIWCEVDALGVASELARVPRLLLADRERGVQVQQLIQGRPLEESHPKGLSISARTLNEIIELARNMSGIPIERVPPLPLDWPEDGDCRGFAMRLMRVTSSVWNREYESHRRFWGDLGFPAQPFEGIDFSELSSRGFGLLHCDLHRKNIILDQEGAAWFIDWELALWGDPMYELAVHLHKMKYPASFERLVESKWVESMRLDESKRSLGMYRRHETVKSAIVDSVRYLDLVTSGGSVDETAVRLHGKMEGAWRIWKMPIHDVEFVRTALVRNS